LTILGINKRYNRFIPTYSIIFYYNIWGIENNQTSTVCCSQSCILNKKTFNNLLSNVIIFFIQKKKSKYILLSINNNNNNNILVFYIIYLLFLTTHWTNQRIIIVQRYFSIMVLWDRYQSYIKNNLFFTSSKFNHLFSIQTPIFRYFYVLQYCENYDEKYSELSFLG